MPHSDVEPCWSCRRRASAPDSALKLKLQKNHTFRPALAGVKWQLDTVDVSVPLCPRCYGIWGTGELGRGITVFAVLLVLLLATFALLVSTAHFLWFVAAGVTVVAFAIRRYLTSLGKRFRAGEDVRPPDSHPQVKKLLDDGYTKV